MPYTIQIDHPRRRFVVVGADPISVSDVLVLFDHQVAAHAWSYGTVHDARHVTWVPNANETDRIVAYVDDNALTLGPRGPVAFVVAPAAFLGMPRVYSQIATESAVEAAVFDKVSHANRWLDQRSTRQRVRSRRSSSQG